MKKFNYSFSDSDVETLILTLSVMPLVELGDVSSIQQSINDSCCTSAIEKLNSSRTDFIPNESHVMYASLKLADCILKGEIEVDSKTKKKISQYLFSINRLLPIFSSIFD